MKIATYNVEFLFDEGDHRHSGKDWVYSNKYVEARIEHLAGKLSEIDADVVFLQEIGSADTVERIIARTGIPYRLFLAKPDRSGVGNAVLYRPGDAEVRSIPAAGSFPVMVEGDQDAIGTQIASRRDFIHLKMTYRDRPLHLFGLHLNSRFHIALRLKDKSKAPSPIETQMDATDALIRSEIVRCVQARAMRKEIDSLFAQDPNALIAVMGDFNSQSREAPLRIIQGELEARSDTLVRIEEGLPSIDAYSFIGDHGKKLIDHVLVSKALERSVTSFKILNTGLVHHQNMPPTPTYVESDHAPLLFELA